MSCIWNGYRCWGPNGASGSGKAESVSAGAIETPENATEETEDAARVFRVGRKAAKQEAKVVTVGGLHGARRVSGGDHGFFDEAGKEVKV